MKKLGFLLLASAITPLTAQTVIATPADCTPTQLSAYLTVTINTDKELQMLFPMAKIANDAQVQLNMAQMHLVNANAITVLTSCHFAPYIGFTWPVNVVPNYTPVTAITGAVVNGNASIWEQEQTTLSDLAAQNFSQVAQDLVYLNQAIAVFQEHPDRVTYPQ